jgi:hypothetical protein
LAKSHSPATPAAHASNLRTVSRNRNLQPPVGGVFVCIKSFADPNMPSAIAPELIWYVPLAIAALIDETFAVSTSAELDVRNPDDTADKLTVEFVLLPAAVTDVSACCASLCTARCEAWLIAAIWVVLLESIFTMVSPELVDPFIGGRM